MRSVGLSFINLTLKSVLALCNPPCRRVHSHSVSKTDINFKPYLTMEDSQDLQNTKKKYLIILSTQKRKKCLILIPETRKQQIFKLTSSYSLNIISFYSYKNKNMYVRRMIYIQRNRLCNVLKLIRKKFIPGPIQKVIEMHT